MKRLMILVFPMICLAVVLICMGSLHGGPAGSSTEEGTVPAESPGLSDLILRVGLALGLIVLLIWGAVYTLRLLGRRTGGPLQGRFKVLDRCYLAPKRALYSVRMGERVVVVGVTETNITPVLELSAEEGDVLYPETPSMQEPAGNFASLLKGVATKAARLRA
jgi:flagellar biogenesis protein FliO